MCRGYMPRYEQSLHYSHFLLEFINRPQGEIIEFSGEQRHLSAIPLKNFYLFKIGN